MKRTVFLALCLALLPIGISGADSYVVVVNRSNPAQRLTKHDLEQIFLKKGLHVGATTYQPVDLPAGAEARQAFSKSVLGKTIPAVNAYWQQQIFSGKNVPPQELDENAAIAFVKANANAIAYVPASNATSAVKVVEVLE